jgi:hypothetical protein
LRTSGGVLNLPAGSALLIGRRAPTGFAAGRDQDADESGEITLTEATSKAAMTHHPGHHTPVSQRPL